jgi:hypothetical protein
VPDFVLVQEDEDQIFISENPSQVLLSTGIQGPPGPPGPAGPPGPPNTTPISLDLGNTLVLGSDSGLFSSPLAWASTNW